MKVFFEYSKFRINSVCRSRFALKCFLNIHSIFQLKLTRFKKCILRVTDISTDAVIIASLLFCGHFPPIYFWNLTFNRNNHTIYVLLFVRPTHYHPPKYLQLFPVIRVLFLNYFMLCKLITSRGTKESFNCIHIHSLFSWNVAAATRH